MDTTSSQPLFTMYSTTWCGHCLQAKQWLKTHGFVQGTDFIDIDIEQDEEACKTVQTINQGNRTVPTLVFPDGSTLTEPTNQELETKLGAGKIG